MPRSAQCLEVPDAARRRRNHYPEHPLLLEPAQVAGFPVGGTVRGAKDHRRSLLVHRVLETAYGLGGERVRGVEHHGAEARAVASAAHLVGGRASDETELVDRLNGLVPGCRERHDLAGSRRWMRCLRIRQRSQQRLGWSRADRACFGPHHEYPQPPPGPAASTCRCGAGSNGHLCGARVPR